MHLMFEEIVFTSHVHIPWSSRTLHYRHRPDRMSVFIFHSLTIDNVIAEKRDAISLSSLVIVRVDP